MLCQKCGAELEEGALVCNVCGAILGSSDVGDMMEILATDSLDFRESTSETEIDTTLFSESTAIPEMESMMFNDTISNLDTEIPVREAVQTSFEDEIPVASALEAMSEVELSMKSPVEDMPEIEKTMASPVEDMPEIEKTMASPVEDMPEVELSMTSPVETMSQEEIPVASPVETMSQEEIPVASPVTAIPEEKVEVEKEEGKKMKEKTKEKKVKEKLDDKQENKNLIMVDKRALFGVGAAVVAAAAAIIFVMNTSYTKKINELTSVQAPTKVEGEKDVATNDNTSAQESTDITGNGDVSTPGSETTGGETTGGETTGGETTGGETTGTDTPDNVGVGNIDDAEANAVIEKHNIDTDSSSCESIESCINATLAEEEVYKEVAKNGQNTGVVLAMAFAQNGTLVMKTTPRCIMLETELKEVLDGLEAPKETGKKFYIGEIETKMVNEGGTPIMEVGKIEVYTSATNVAKVTKLNQKN